MAKHLKLDATKRLRSGTNSVKQMRREGLVPGIIYGSKMGDPINLKVRAKTFEDIMHHSATQNLLIDLHIEEDSAPSRLALVQDVQHHPLTGKVIHIDFHAVSENEKIHASVPVELIGDCPGVKAGGLLEHMLHSIEVHCLPKDLPEGIETDVSKLEMGDAVHVSELDLPEGVEASIAGDVIVAVVTELRATAAEAAADGGEAPAEPEVTKEKKSDDAGEGN